jgi:integrase
MPRKTTNRAANGNGSIRKVTKTKNGKQYTYWEGRVTVGYDPGTGKQKQRTVSGKTQKEVTQKMREITAELDAGTYHEPCKLTVGEWLDIWLRDYLNGVKPRTAESYRCQIENHIRPNLSKIKLEALSTPDIQKFYNSMTESGLAAKTVIITHGVLHKALQQAVAIGYLRFNPSDACTLPRSERKELKPLDDNAISAFLTAVKGHPYETVFLVTLFTGMRQGEVLGLTWNCVDLDNGTLLINKQLQKAVNDKGKREYSLVSTKNSKGRKITLASTVVNLLRQQKAKQEVWKQAAGSAWRKSDFVFTNELGEHLMPHTVYHNYKRIVAAIGRPDARFHDLRHSYAVAAIKSGDDIKTVQGNLGHATASFTLDVYGHVTDQMKRESANRMEQFIQSVSTV